MGTKGGGRKTARIVLIKAACVKRHFIYKKRLKLMLQPFLLS